MRRRGSSSKFMFWLFHKKYLQMTVTGHKFEQRNFVLVLEVQNRLRQTVRMSLSTFLANMPRGCVMDRCVL
jgi:hypothetical protein